MEPVIPNSLRLLADPLPWEHCHAVVISRGELTIYNVFRWPDGTIQAGIPSCKLNASELQELRQFLKEV